MIYCVRGSCPGPLDECGVLFVVISLSKSGAKVRLFFDMAKFIFYFFLVAIRKMLYHSNEKVKLFLSSTPIPSAKTHQNTLFFTKIGTFLIEKYLVSDVCIS